MALDDLVDRRIVGRARAAGGVGGLDEVRRGLRVGTARLPAIARRRNPRAVMDEARVTA